MPTALLPFRATVILESAGAPAHEFSALDDVVTWAESNLGFDFTCGPRTPGAGNAGRARHWVRIDPHTADCTPAPTIKQQEKADGVHLLAALSGRTPECQRISPSFNDWVGHVHPGAPAPWPTTGSVSHYLSTRRNVVRIVQFIDKGLDLHAHESWLRIGAHPGHVTHANRLLREAGIEETQPELCAHLARITGVEWNALRGKRAETSARWLYRDIEKWVNRRRNEP